MSWLDDRLQRLVVRGTRWALGVLVGFGVLVPAHAESPISTILNLLGGSKSAPQADEDAAFQQTGKIAIRGKDGAQLKSFCLGPDGRLYGLVGAPEYYGGGERPKAQSAIHVYSVDGESQAVWPIDFPAQKVAVESKEHLLVAGTGRIARLDLEGKIVATNDLAQYAKLKGEPDALRKAAEAFRDQQVKSYSEYAKQIETTVKALEDRQKKLEETSKEGLDDSKEQEADESASGANAESEPQLFIFFGGESSVGKMNAAQVKLSLDAHRQQWEEMKKQVEQMEKKPIEEYAQDVLDQEGSVHSLSANQSGIFVATRSRRSPGFTVWKLDAELKTGDKIISGLSGCCGQMDVQVLGSELFVAENSRHRVVRYDLGGKKLSSFGKANRGGSGDGFGGCCNPMNLCFTRDGNLLTSESEGKIKLYTPDGKYLGLAGSIRSPSGCKNVAIALSPDEKRLFFYDQANSCIVVLEKKPTPEVPAKTQANAGSGG